MDRMKFPHLENLSARGVTSILNSDYVTVTEKIDGFNARLGMGLEGEVWVGTRNREFDPDKEPMQGFGAFGIQLATLLRPGDTIFGEWAGNGIQRRLDYGEPGFWFFDGHHERDYGDDDGSWFDPDDMDEYAKTLNLRRPRMFHEGLPPTVGQLDVWRSTPGIEGVVIRAYPMAVDVYGHPLIAKFKSAEFSERKSERAQKAPPDMANVTAFVAEYATAERLHHVLAGVAEGFGEDPLSMEMTGEVLRAMYHDIIREGADDYAALSEADQKLVGRVSAMTTKALLEAARVEALTWVS